MKRRVKLWILLAVLLASGLIVAANATRTTAQHPATCVSVDGVRVVVHTAEHRLVLCEGESVHATYSVRLGRGGVGKTREGDERTPLGTYSLGAPRASTSYGTFMAVGYPTADQRRRGNTGGSIGVHGPDRRVTWLGSLVNALDTTDGCIGIATDAEMDAVGAWTRAEHVTTIEID